VSLAEQFWMLMTRLIDDCESPIGTKILESARRQGWCNIQYWENTLYQKREKEQ
jgi:hypothetical protein